MIFFFFCFSSRRRHTRFDCDWSSDVCSSDLTADGVSELSTAVSVPRHSADVDQAHGLESELLYGGSLELREQPYESYFKNVIILSRPLRKGERHRYAIRLRIPVGQLMAPHYVYVPFSRSD